MPPAPVINRRARKNSASNRLSITDTNFFSVSNTNTMPTTLPLLAAWISKLSIALGSRKFSSWIFKIAHNSAIDYLRKRRVQTVPLESPPEQEGGQLADILAGPERDEPEQVAVRGELAEALELAMASLRPEQREVLLLRFQHGLSYAELSEVMSLPLGTIKTHLHRARKRLAQIFEGTEWDPEELGK